tara:strand:+ start:557 stop:838 length:282 start_codon:yes stop_codon:yes gene_type:complete
MLFGGMPSLMTTMIDNTKGHITSKDNMLSISTNLEVKGRNILQELDEIKHHMLLLPRDQELEEKYPELKEAYDAYLELYRGVQIARKMMEVNE